MVRVVSKATQRALSVRRCTSQPLLDRQFARVKSNAALTHGLVQLVLAMMIFSSPLTRTDEGSCRYGLRA